MAMIISEQGYPKDDEILIIVNYFIKASPCEGGILIIGKDSQGKEYRPKTEQVTRHSYALPSGTEFSVAVGADPEKNHPAIYFAFELDQRHWRPNIVDAMLEDQTFDDEFFSKFDLTLMNESMQKILLDAEVERTFKEIAIWGAYELKGLVRNHFWGEMYYKKTPALEKFLEEPREINQKEKFQQTVANSPLGSCLRTITEILAYLHSHQPGCDSFSPEDNWQWAQEILADYLYRNFNSLESFQIQLEALAYELQGLNSDPLADFRQAEESIAKKIFEELSDTTPSNEGKENEGKRD